MQKRSVVAAPEPKSKRIKMVRLMSWWGGNKNKRENEKKHTHTRSQSKTSGTKQKTKRRNGNGKIQKQASNKRKRQNPGRGRLQVTTGKRSSGRGWVWDALKIRKYETAPLNPAQRRRRRRPKSHHIGTATVTAPTGGLQQLQGAHL